MFISVWCFFTALISTIVYFVMCYKKITQQHFILIQLIKLNKIAVLVCSHIITIPLK
jgi:hypothetical protein